MRRIVFPGGAGNTATAPDAPANSPTGSFGIVARLSPATTSAGYIASKYGGAGNRSWAFAFRSGDRLLFAFSEDGTAITNHSSSVAVPFSAGTRAWVRMAFDATTGTTTFYTSTSDTNDPEEVVWTQLGTPQGGSGTVTLFDSSWELMLGSTGSGSDNVFEGQLYRLVMEVASSEVVDINPSDPTTWDGHKRRFFEKARGAIVDLQGDVSLAGNALTPGRIRTQYTYSSGGVIIPRDGVNTPLITG